MGRQRASQARRPDRGSVRIVRRERTRGRDRPGRRGIVAERGDLGWASAGAGRSSAPHRGSGPYHRPVPGPAFVALALAWLVGASMFLYGSMRSAEMARATRAKYEIDSAALVYVDSDRERPKLFVSARYGLSGRPDAVLLEALDRIALLEALLAVVPGLLRPEMAVARVSGRSGLGDLAFGDEAHEVAIHGLARQSEARCELLPGCRPLGLEQPLDPLPGFHGSRGCIIVHLLSTVQHCELSTIHRRP